LGLLGHLARHEDSGILDGGHVPIVAVTAGAIERRPVPPSSDVVRRPAFSPRSTRRRAFARRRAVRDHRTITERTYRTTVGSQTVDLPLVQVAPDVTIALLICVDHGVTFSERAGKELADLLRDARPEVVVSVATMGIPLAIEVSRALELDDYVILHKTPKIHLGDHWVEPVRSITTGADQTLRLDPARVDAVKSRRVAIVDDVVSTGASLQASLNLLRRVGAEPVVVGAFLTEGAQWRRSLGDDAEMVRALGAIPLFRNRPDGSLEEDWSGA
jgi:adenine/guanine phosphoribosyltransferase-like PRPP-binding protein